MAASRFSVRRHDAHRHKKAVCLLLDLQVVEQGLVVPLAHRVVDLQPRPLRVQPVVVAGLGGQRGVRLPYQILRDAQQLHLARPSLVRGEGLVLGFVELEVQLYVTVDAPSDVASLLPHVTPHDRGMHYLRFTRSLVFYSSTVPMPDAVRPFVVITHNGKSQCDSTD